MKVAVCLSIVVVIVYFLCLWVCLKMSAASDPGDVEIYEDIDGNIVIHKLEE